jgi:hypothetical protein
MLEPLEDRIAPAVFVNAHIVTYTDSAGQLATIDSSLPIFTKTNFTNILTFKTTGSTQQLQEINLTSLSAATAGGDNLSVTAHSGLANVGVIEAGFGLGHVVIQGDLGRIDVGSASNNAPGLTSLTVNSLGQQGKSTQPSSGASLVSTIFGPVGSITVHRDILNAGISVIANSAGAAFNGTIGSIIVGGSIIGGSGDLSGSISTGGSVGSIDIGGNLQGGSGSSSGSLQIEGGIGSLTVDNIIGYKLAGDKTGMGASSGSVATGQPLAPDGGIGALIIKGNLQGGDGNGSGEIYQDSDSSGSYKSVKIGGSILGGSGQNSGELSSNGIGSITIGGSLTGGSGQNSGELSANTFGSITIGKGIKGSSGALSGYITSVDGISSIDILSGGITGGTATDAGSIQAATAPTGAALIDSIVVHGNITGVAAAGSSVTGTGQIHTSSSIGSLTLYGSLVGAAAEQSGSVIAVEALGSVSIHGSILGGTGTGSGQVNGYSIASLSIAGQVLGSGTGSGKIAATGAIHALHIGGSLAGGTGAGSGEISAASIDSVIIGGDVQGSGPSSGAIVATGSIGSIVIGGGLDGGDGTGSGVITTGSPSAFGDNLGSLTISGGIAGGDGSGSGQVSIGGLIQSVHLRGSAITGGSGASSGAIVATDNIGSISLGSLIAGTGASSGQISTGGNLAALGFTGATSSSTADSGLVNIAGSAGAIAVHGNIVGGAASTGLFLIGGAVNTFSVYGALRGGGGLDSGSIFTGLDEASFITSLTVTGGVIGGGGASSGQVYSGGGIGQATLSGLAGGGGQASGNLVSNGPLGAITLSGSAPGVVGIVGGSGVSSGRISSGATIGAIFLHGNLKGGSGSGSGAIVSNSSFTPTGDIQGNIGTIAIFGNIIGGTGANSGQISAAGNLKTLGITGSVTGGQSSGAGAILAGTDLTGLTGGDITTLKIDGALRGASFAAGAGTVTGSGYIEAGRIGSATLGAILAGTVAAGDTVSADAAILAANNIASLTVTGGITGAASDPVVISANGNPGASSDVAFAKIAVAGNVTYANFLAGYDQAGLPSNGAAGIGSVTVGGDWSGSNLVAGVIAANGHFGDPHATLIDTADTPTITSIVIKGEVINAPVAGSANTYGFVGREIGSFTLHGIAQNITAGLIDPVGQSTDAVLRDVT